jgi:hypothetical protein
MATQKSSGNVAKTLSTSSKAAPNGASASVAKSDKSDGSKPSVDEIRKRAYEIFQARHADSAVRSRTGKRPRPPSPQMRPRQMRRRLKGAIRMRPKLRRPKMCTYRLIPGRSRTR